MQLRITARRRKPAEVVSNGRIVYVGSKKQCQNFIRVKLGSLRTLNVQGMTNDGEDIVAEKW